MTQSVIKLEGVCFCRTEQPILSDVSWKIEPRQHWALLGANGSGKTTLLKILTGYEWPTFGTVRVLGQEFGVCDIGKLRKLIGWVSSAMTQRLPIQDEAVEVVASGLDASIGLYRHITDEEYDQSLAILKKLQVESIAGHNYGTLSQGEMQKVLIARALVSRPKVLILDEPVCGYHIPLHIQEIFQDDLFLDQAICRIRSYVMILQNLLRTHCFVFQSRFVSAIFTCCVL